MRVESIELYDFGKLEIKNERIELDPNSPTGHFLYADDIRFIGASNDVFPVEKGLKFGIEYWVWGETGIEKDLVTLERKTIHPEIQNPETKLSFTETIIRTKCRLNETTFDYHSIEFDWEVKKGTYIFQVIYEGSILLEKTFTLT